MGSGDIDRFISVVRSEMPLQPARVDADDFVFDKMIGTGSFSDVFRAISRVSEAKTKCLASSSREVSDSRFSAKKNLDSGRLFAVKRLNEKTLLCPCTTVDASRDLLKEVAILSRLPPHQNIITLHAVSSSFWEDTPRGFLVLELMMETLHGRLHRWRKHRKSTLGRFLPGFESRRNHWAGHVNRVAMVGPPLASAMAFLHVHEVCHRDLKPQNIGFDQNGKLRLFDFGLSRMLSEEEDDKDRRLSRCAGTCK